MLARDILGIAFVGTSSFEQFGRGAALISAPHLR